MMPGQANSEPSPPPEPTPHALLDAGGETWERLGALVHRRVQDLATGEILEITTGQPDVPRALRAWCVGHGHAVRSRAEGGHTSFWVTKGGCGEGAEDGAGQG